MIDRAIGLDPSNAAFFSNRGNALAQLERYDEALASYDHALKINPDDAKAVFNRGSVLQTQKRFGEALKSFDLAISLEPEFVEAHNNRGNTLSELKRFEEALASYDRALMLKPEHFTAHYNRGIALKELKRFGEAVASYDRALALEPDDAGAFNNRGIALEELGRIDEALASYSRALKLKPEFAEALKNRGGVLTALGRFDQALECYDRAVEIKPDYPFNFGRRLHCKMMICDWRNLSDDFDRLGIAFDGGEPMSLPFPVLAMPHNAAQQKKCAEIYIKERFPKNQLLPQIKTPYEHDRIRLGYFSSDFRNHVASYVMAELFERHDRNRFELFAFSFGPTKKDAMRKRLENAFDHFVEVGFLSDKAVAQLARRLEIDIAVDLKGFTRNSRMGIFATRAAPIQVNYMGYPATTGAEYMDYLITDSMVVPKDQRQHYAEQIVYLPDTYWVNDSTRPIAKKVFTKADCGLPDEGFVFCCFNNNYKINPAIFDIWMRLLDRVEGSVLWLLEGNAFAGKKLKGESPSARR